MRMTVALLATVAALVMPAITPGGAQEAMEKKSYNYSAWTREYSPKR